MRKVNQDYPVNTDDYPDLIDEDSEDQQIENEVAEELNELLKIYRTEDWK